MPRVRSVVRQLELPVEIVRTAPPPTLLPFTEFFSGFENVPAVRTTFGVKTDEILGALKIEFFANKYIYMAVNHRDAHLIVSTWHLKHSDTRTLYLDVIHELFHVGQFLHDREFFWKQWERLLRNPLAYFRNPIEVSAYRHTVEEAMRIGMSTEEIASYLDVTWATPEERARFLTTVGVKSGKGPETKGLRLPVKIRRNAPITLRPFTDYFRGFERVPEIRNLFGNEMEQVLNRLKVEFCSSPLGYVAMNDEDAHMMASAPYLRDSDLSILYLDVFLYLQFVAQFLDGRAQASEAFNPFSGATVEHEEPRVRDALSRKVGFHDYRDYLSRKKKNKDFMMYDFPTIVDAYKRTVEEARRIGMSQAEIMEYLNSPEIAAMTPARLKRFARNLGLIKKAS
jgi:hypothetical protein